MNPLRRLFDKRPEADTVAARVEAAIRVVPGVVAVDVGYNHQRNSSGAVTGEVNVADSPAFLAVLREVRAELGEVLGGDADRVTFYLSGRTPDDAPITPADLGLSLSPSGREVRERLG